MNHLPKALLTVLVIISLFVLVVIMISTSDTYTSENEIAYNISEKLTEIVSPPDIPRVPLDTVLHRIETVGPINSILISKNGELIAEEYFRGMHSGQANNIKSASKSILSILTGIAIDQGYLDGIDQTIEEFFPEYFSENRNSGKAFITIGDLLTMRAGLQSTSGRRYGRWVTSSDWIRYALDRPLVGEPGNDRIYSTGTTHLLAVVLARATNMSTLAFANQYLFNPLDIKVHGWDRDPQGNYMGGNNMALLPSDMIKIGQMMMDMGVYNDKRIVSPDWILQSIQPLTGRGPIDDYGYLWFRRMAGDNHVIYAWGNGGQFIQILPELNAVIAVTSANQSGATRNYSRRLMRTLDNDIVPYLR
ncbi:MAG: serine hydrolase [Balneolales bacterium]